MYICHCNPFTDKDVDKALKNKHVCNKVVDVYKACSGGKSPNCGTCLCEVQRRIQEHDNHKKTKTKDFQVGIPRYSKAC